MSETDWLTQPLYVNLDQQKSVAGRQEAFGTVLDLYNNVDTGEHVEMCWIKPGHALPTTDQSNTTGEEIFVMDGSLALLDTKEEYTKWGWLRFPVHPGKERSSLTAGSAGAQVYRKVGHLTEDALSKEKIQITDDDNGDN